MSQNKRYYWLKLKDDFFKDLVIKKLRKIAGGDTYTIIYLKLLLLSLKNEGKLYFEGVEESFVEEMALELDEDTDNVSVTLNYLQKNNLIEMVDSDEYFLTETKNITGCESASALRVRRHREQKKGNEALQCNTTVTPLKRQCNKNVTPEIEIEKEFRDKNINSSNEELICSEPLASQTSDPTPAAKKPEIKLTESKIPLLTVDKKTGQKIEYTVSQVDFDELVEAYPAVDVPQALRMMRQWTLSNLTKAKKRNGIRRFITNWLTKEQNNGGTPKVQTKAQSSGAGESARRMTFAEQEEHRNQLNQAGGVLKFDGEAKFLEYCKNNNINPDEARA